MKSKIVAAFFLIALIVSCKTEIKKNSMDSITQQKIRTAFDDWAEEEIKKGTFFAQDSCSPSYYYMKDSLGLEAVTGFAIPLNDSSRIDIYYADLNADNTKDALITFSPDQCDGGNAGMWIQYQILVLSQGDKYVVIDDYFDQFYNEPILGSGFFHLDSADTKTVFGTYFNFMNDDGRCCPSIQRPIKIDLEKNEFNYLDQ